MQTNTVLASILAGNSKKREGKTNFTGFSVQIHEQSE
jgi:hypothetical protein